MNVVLVPEDVVVFENMGAYIDTKNKCFYAYDKQPAMSQDLDVQSLHLPKVVASKLRKLLCSLLVLVLAPQISRPMTVLKHLKYRYAWSRYSLFPHLTLNV